MTRRLILGTRGSNLARRQSDLVIEALRGVEPAIDVELQIIRTEGDRRQDVSLDAIGGQGVFVKDIELLLQRGEIDIAVHSLKDMPADNPKDLVIGAVLPRGDARDALVARDSKQLAELSPGARVGTDSKRRSVQLLALRPDIKIVSIRGNVDTRIRKVMDGEYDAVVLAVAGLERLDRLSEASEIFEIDDLLPAVGQGVLAIQCRDEDAEVLGLLHRIDDNAAHVASTAERAFLRTLGAGCSLPTGAYAEVGDGRVRLRGMLAGDDGIVHRHETMGNEADIEWLGATLAHTLMDAAGVTQGSTGLEIGPRE